MNKRILGALMTGALAFTVACSKSDKKSSTTEVQTVGNQNGDWVVEKTEGDDSVFKADNKISIVEKDGERFLVLGSESFPFKKNIELTGVNIESGFELSDGRVAAITKHDSENGEQLFLTIYGNKTCAGSLCELESNKMVLSRPGSKTLDKKADDAAVKPESEKAEVLGPPAPVSDVPTDAGGS